MSKPPLRQRSAASAKARWMPWISSTEKSAGSRSSRRLSSMEATAPQRWMASLTLVSPCTTMGSARFTT